MDLGGDFEVLDFRIGKSKADYSYAKLLVKGKNKNHLKQLMKEVYLLGAIKTRPVEASLKPAPANMILPGGFYSTTSHPTSIYLGGKWIDVEQQMMDKVIVYDEKVKRVFCKSIRQVKKGDLIAVGEEGVRVKPPERPRRNLGVFEFMVSKASSEKPSTSIVRGVAQDIIQVENQGGKVVVVAGPAIVHTGAANSFAKIIRLGCVDALLSGNALAVHALECALYGTSLGINIKTGLSSPGSHRNHISAINEVYKAGSMKALVKKGRFKEGIIYECIVNHVPFVLAGSIRDDGPLPEVITDTVEAQIKYKELLKNASIVLMFASMLHSVATGNLLPSTIKTVSVDINPAVALKLMDRGTGQTAGIVSDIGTFIPLLEKELEALQKGGEASPGS